MFFKGRLVGIQNILHKITVHARCQYRYCIDVYILMYILFLYICILRIFINIFEGGRTLYFVYRLSISVFIFSIRYQIFSISNVYVDLDIYINIDKVFRMFIQYILVQKFCLFHLFPINFHCILYIYQIYICVYMYLVNQEVFVHLHYILEVINKCFHTFSQQRLCRYIYQYYIYLIYQKYSHIFYKYICWDRKLVLLTCF
eukprot:TRINITY_DN6938_c1_g1_i10.p2 TRINITY_DN6938_c1_g1~~TRINITY_DN6938_c1_g1_i10.p2  ORF type:complete len:201 (-),score=-31.20 TRINITY_DN6938_c1_g1_i10:752-1354(-)